MLTRDGRIYREDNPPPTWAEASKEKFSLGTVYLPSFEEEEQEALYRSYKAQLAPGDFFPGDAFVKGLDGVTNDPIECHVPMTQFTNLDAHHLVRAKVGLRISAGHLVVSTNCVPPYQPPFDYGKVWQFSMTTYMCLTTLLTFSTAYCRNICRRCSLLYPYILYLPAIQASRRWTARDRTLQGTKAP